MLEEIKQLGLTCCVRWCRKNSGAHAAQHAENKRYVSALLHFGT